MIKNKKLSLLFFSMLLVGQSVFSSIKEEEVQAEETTQENELVSYSDQTGLFLSMDEDGNITYVEPEMADEETDTTLPEEEDPSTTFDVKLETEDGDVIDVDEFSTMEEAQMYVDVMEMNKELSSLIEDTEEEEETSTYEGTSSSDEEESTTSTAAVTSKTRSSEITYLSEEEEIEDYDVSIYTNDKLRATTATSVVVFTNYSSTTSYYEDGTGIAGYTNANYAADAAYLGTSGTKVKFMLAGVTGWVDASNVSIVTYSSSLNVSYYKVTNGKLYHYISTNINGSGPASAQYMGAAPSYLKENTKYYSYDGHYFYSSYATMISDYQSGSVSNSVNPKSVFYNYYQYLSQRSQTSFTASELNTRINNALKSYTNGSSSILKDQGSNLIAAEQYGVNAALVLGLAANESAWGLSSIALNKNNLFGLNAVDSSPGTSADTFASAAACINDFAKNWVSLGYADPTDWRYYGSHYGDKQSGMNVKYASDPYWGEKAAAQGYYLEDQTGKSDSTKYSIAVNNGEATYVYKEASTSSTILYGTGNTNFKTIYEYPVIVLDTVTNSEGTWYKIKSDAILNSSRTALSTANTGIYDHSLNYVYIQANSSFPIVYTGSNSDGGSSSSGSSSGSSSSGSSSSGSSSDSSSSGSSSSGSSSGSSSSGSSSSGSSSGSSSSGSSSSGSSSGSSSSGSSSSGSSSSSSSSSSNSSSTSTTLGDVNGDGKISSLDYIKVKNHIMGTKTLTSDEQTRADVNKDGKITSLDYIKIKNHIMGTSKIS